MYQMARKPTKAAFEYHMGEVEKLNAGAAEKLRSIPPNTWANYACRDNTIWNQVTSNMAESVNNMVGPVVRLPFLHHTYGAFSRGVLCAMLWYWNSCHMCLFPGR